MNTLLIIILGVGDYYEEKAKDKNLLLELNSTIPCVLLENDGISRGSIGKG